MRFDIGYTAQYSPRSGTAAFRAFKDDVSREVKKQRWNELQTVMEETVLSLNQAYVGKTVSVLVDHHEKLSLTDEMLLMPKSVQEAMLRRPGHCFGNSREMKLVRFAGGEDLVGKIVEVRIEKAMTWMLDGKKVNSGN